MIQNRHWDGTTLRMVRDNPIEIDLRAQCSMPRGTTPQNEEWWYRQARQANACFTGPFGKALSNWSASYAFLQDACVIHDMCYQSDQSRGYCDSTFLENIRALCANVGASDFVLWPFCQAVAGGAGLLATTDPRFQSSYDKGQVRRQKNVGADSPTGINLALDGTAWQNSTYQSFSGPEKAIDGNTNATYIRNDDNSVSHTKNEHTTAWTVNLGDNRQVNRVVIFNGDDPSQWKRLSGALVQCWRNDTPAVSAKAFWLPNMSQLPYHSMDFGGVLCGTIRVIHQEKSQYLVMAEVQVWGR